MQYLCCVSLQHDSTITNKHHWNQSVDHSHSRNSLYGGACRLETISSPNDDVLEGDFEFPIVATMLRRHTQTAKPVHERE